MGTTSRRIVTFTIGIDEDGNVFNDTQTHDSTFAEVYAAFQSIKAEVDRQIKDRRQCPYNPAFQGPTLFERAR